MFCELHMSTFSSARAEDWDQQILLIILLLVSVPILILESYGNLHGLPMSLYNSADILSNMSVF